MKKFFISLAILLVLPVSLVFVGCNPKPKELVLNTESVKTEYVVGESVDLDGLEVKLRYSDGTSEDVEDWTSDVSGVNIAVDGTYTITISYDKFSTTFEVTYFKKGTITAVSNNVYYVGQDFKSAYPELKYASDKDGVRKVVAYNVVSFDNETAGDDKVAVLEYMNERYECKVKVLSKDDYFEYLKGKIVDFAAKYKLNNLKMEKENELYFLNGAADDGSYGKKGEVETYVKNAEVTTYISGQKQEQVSTYMDYDEAIRNAFGITDETIHLPLSAAYSPLVSRLFLTFDGLENPQEAEYSTTASYLTISVKLEGSEDVAIMFTVDLRDYSLMNAKLDGWDMEFNIDYEIPAPSAPSVEG